MMADLADATKAEEEAIKLYKELMAAKTKESLGEMPPEKAWQLSSTFIVGYWGRCFCNGAEHRTSWKADSLEPGDHVGLLVTPRGELHAWVNGARRVRVDARIPVTPGEGEAAPRMLPVVDVFAATSAVRWVHGAEPPGFRDGAA